MRVNRSWVKINNRRQLLTVYCIVVERDWFDYHTYTLLSNHHDSSLCRWWNTFRRKQLADVHRKQSVAKPQDLQAKCPLTVGKWRAILGPGAENEFPVHTSQTLTHPRMWNNIYVLIYSRRRPSLPLAAWFTSWWLPHHWFCIKYRGVTN